jgi:hypothetical protein
MPGQAQAHGAARVACTGLAPHPRQDSQAPYVNLLQQLGVSIMSICKVGIGWGSAGAKAKA